jgi:hypothetical protein
MTRKPYNRYYPQSNLKKVETTDESTSTELSFFSGIKTMQELFEIYQVTNIADLKAAVSRESKVIKDKIAIESKAIKEQIAEEKAEAKIKKITERAAAGIVKSTNKR